MRLTKKIQNFSLSIAALRTCGMLCLLAGLMGRLLQNSVLGVDSMTNAELLDAMQADSNTLLFATLALVFQAMEACAVPIFAFLLVEGAVHTQRFGKYFLRVLAMAAACQLPYNLITTGSLLMLSRLNPVFALVMSMIMVYFFRRCAEKTAGNAALKIIAILGTFLWSKMLGVEHGAACVLLTAVLWGLRGKPNLQTLVGILVAVCCSVFSLYYMAAPISFLLLHFYSGEPGGQNKIVNYSMYPAMLVIFGLLTILL